MSAELVIGNGLELDDGVTLGYRPSRSAATVLTLGAGARLRSGTVTYARSKIGRHFETGHHVVIREGTSIGTAVSVWSNTVVDYGCVIWGQRHHPAVRDHRAGAIIGAGSVVTRDVAPGVVAHGNPAVPGRHVEELEGLEARLRAAHKARMEASSQPSTSTDDHR